MRARSSAAAPNLQHVRLVRFVLWGAEALNAHEQALAHGFSATDDASVLEWYGHPVAIAEGSYTNLKITTPEDLILAQALLNEGDIKKEHT